MLIAPTVGGNRKKQTFEMKLAGKKQWILGIFALMCGLVLTGYFSIVQYGVIRIPILLITGFIGLLIIIFVSIYANK